MGAKVLGMLKPCLTGNGVLGFCMTGGTLTGADAPGTIQTEPVGVTVTSVLLGWEFSAPLDEEGWSVCLALFLLSIGEFSLEESESEESVFGESDESSWKGSVLSVSSEESSEVSSETSPAMTP